MAGIAADELAPSGSTYWGIADLEYHCRVSRKTAWRLVRSPGFPAPVVLGRRVVWPRGEVLAFIEDKRDPDRYTTEPARPARAHAPFSTREVRRRAS